MPGAGPARGRPTGLPLVLLGGGCPAGLTPGATACTLVRQMRPFLLALLLLLLGVAHAGAGTWAAGRASAWLVTPLWLVAMTGFLAVSFAIFGVDRLRIHSEPMTLAATLASDGLLRLAGVGVWSLIGLMIGLAFCGLVRWWIRCTHPEIRTPTVTTGDVPVIPEAPTLRERIGAVAAYGALLITALLIVLRPWHTAWGTTAAERAAAVPGVARDAEMRYRIDRGVTVHAPGDRVWRWVPQLGQDGAGLHHNDWLARAAGDVKWGVFVVAPIDASTSRLLVHTRGPGEPSLGALPMSPVGFYLLEPAQFILERGMLLRIKERAERAYAGSREDVR